jgi:hypothetical protein
MLSLCLENVRKFNILKQTNKEREKTKRSQTSQLENPEELRLHHHREKSCFDCAVALCTMQNALLVISNLT